MPQYRDEPLERHPVPSFKKGYNSYSGSKTLIDDEEFPEGVNVLLDDNGSIEKRNGKTRYGTEVSSGNPITGMGQLVTNSLNDLIVASGTQWHNLTQSSSSALSGMTFTANRQTTYAQAIDRLYGANGVDNLAYTSNGTSITEVSSNGNVGEFPVYYASRLYMTNATFKDRIYYSNPINIDYSGNPPSLSTTDFGTFDTDLSASPNKKNAGYIILVPGGGVVITRLFKDINQGTESIYAYTKNHGIWQITFSSIDSSGAVIHTIRQIVNNFGSPAGLSVVKVGNDQEFFGDDNIYSLGEVAQYQNLRITTKSGRVRQEILSIPAVMKSRSSAMFFKEKLYFSYSVGTFNNRLLIRDTRLNAWSAPQQGINAYSFIEFVDSTGDRKLLAGSADPSDSYVYELESTQNDQGAAVLANFTTKSFDCKRPGLIKRFAFIDVFYATLFGSLTYEVFLDEVLSITGTLQIGTSATSTDGFGSQPMGEAVMGYETNGGSPASLTSNGKFRIKCGFKAGKRISIKFTNNNVNEQFKINSLVIYYLSGSVYEE